MQQSLSFQYQINSICDLVKPLDLHFSDVVKQYGKGHYKADFVGQPLTVLTENLLNLTSAVDTFENSAWWKYKGFDESDQAYFLESQRRHLKFFFFIKLYSVIEAQFRVLYRKIRVTNSNSGTEAFKTIYDFILRHFGIYDDYVALFDFCRLNRNVIHNLGIHSAETQTIVYNGVAYTFVKWQEVLMLTPELINTIYADLCQSIIDIKKSMIFTDLNN